MNLTGDQRYFLTILGQTGFVRPDQVLPLLRINEPGKEPGHAEAMLHRLRILVDRIQLRRRGRELVHMGDFKHGDAGGVSLKRIFCKSLFHSLTTFVISNSSASPPVAPPASFLLHKTQWHTPGRQWHVPVCSSPAAS